MIEVARVTGHDPEWAVRDDDRRARRYSVLSDHDPAEVPTVDVARGRRTERPTPARAELQSQDLTWGGR